MARIFSLLLRSFLLYTLLNLLPNAQAGTIGFTLSFLDNTVSVTNTGSDAAFLVSIWSLDPSGNWKKMDAVTGDAKYLPAAASLVERQTLGHGAGALAANDPILVIFYDQAGSRMVQLAWRTPPNIALVGLGTQRDGGLVTVDQAMPGPDAPTHTYAIAVPYQGISRLANPFSIDEINPPNPVRHAWSDGPSFSLDTGKGQAGVWLIHEAANGSLRLQIVVDGINRGQENLPIWLPWIRVNLGWISIAAAGLFGLLMLMRSLASTQLAQRPRGVPTLATWALNFAMVLVPAVVMVSLLGATFIWSQNMPTGGDAASHLLYAWTYANKLLPQGLLTGWMPEVFAGFPFLSYYFPLPFISVSALSTAIPFAPAMKIGMFLAAMFLPGSVWLASVYVMRLPRGIAFWGALASMAFLLHEQNSIWGGNLLSTLAGEFAYSYGMYFAVLALFAWMRVIETGRGIWLVVLFEAATGFSHGFALLVLGFSTTAFLFERRNFFNNVRMLVFGHGLAFMLLGGWLWPMMEMHSITIPNDATFEVQSWLELVPRTVQPTLAAGILAAFMLIVRKSIPALSLRFPLTIELQRSLRSAGFMASAALLAATGYLAAGQIGLANIRFFPFVWLLGGIAAAWLWGVLLQCVFQGRSHLLSAGYWAWGATCSVGLFGWMCLNLSVVSDWALWNHSGLEAKPQWNQLSTLFPKLSGDLSSPRLLFEHDPQNSDIGSTRALEALPMFLGGRPVLEGLYMESAIVSPAIYQLQSEVSTHPSSPLARFPSASMDTSMAAAHMRFLYANEVLIRNDETLRAFRASSDFVETNAAPPFHTFALKDFNSHLVDVVDRPLKWYSKENWMEQSFQWFKSNQRFIQELPVFHDGPALRLQESHDAHAVSDLNMQRQQIRWRTSAVGSAHLVRVAWHPRWHLVSKGQLLLAGPGFMVVVPEESDVILEYGHTPLGIAGMLSSLLASLAVIGLILKHRRNPQESLGVWPREGVAALWPALLLCVCAWLYINNPERLYGRAWDLLRSNQAAQAAPEFDAAYRMRKVEAKKEEALFWSAKAYENSDQIETALERYRELTTRFHGYWLPEALYSQSRLARQLKQLGEADTAKTRLIKEFSTSVWSQRATKEFGP
jgi:tetratricopeptide (TPR) repeat protein